MTMLGRARDMLSSLLYIKSMDKTEELRCKFVILVVDVDI